MTDGNAVSRLAAALAGRYRIERELGAGGMATVYLAEDLKHDRKVALKVLRPELAAVLGADRFVQEIKTTAALQHPHILPLFDSGEVDGFLFYVMPYVEGETLRDKLNRETQFSIDDAVRITTEVADALDYAHRHGVVHRDIKPENILLHDGRPMVADFGIALALSAAAGGRMTETGMSLGTPHYMSPEQATADKDITGRSDIYSLASVLYEMLTGNPPHVGNSAQQIIAKIVTEEAQPVTKLRKSVPRNVAAALSQALEKLPADRFAGAKAFAEALTNPSFTTASAASAAATTVRRARLTVYALAACVAFAALAAWALFRPRPEPPVTKQWIGLDVHRPGGAPVPGWPLTTAIAPDGSAIVFADSFPQESNAALWIKERGSAQAVPLLGSAGGTQPFFSPDGQWIGFATVSGVYKVPRSGGAPLLISDSGTNIVGGSVATGVWLDDGSVVFVNRRNVGLMRVTPDGTLRTVATVSGPGIIFQLAPLPSSRGVLAVTCSNFPCTVGTLRAVDLERDTVLTLVSGPTRAWYIDLGFVVYGRGDGRLVAQHFDPRGLALAGAAVPVLNGVRTNNGFPAAVIAAEGTLLYESSTATTTSALTLAEVSRTGVATVLDSTVTLTAQGTGGISLSPDGRRVALVQATPQGTDVYVKDLPRGPVTRLTFGGHASRPSWSADGREVLYISQRDSANVVMERPADGSGTASEVMHEARSIAEGLESPDGKWLIWRTDEITPGRGDILARRTSGDTTTIPLVATPFPEVTPAVSPDDRWLAYSSSQSGKRQVFVRPLSTSDQGRWQVSNDRGWEPHWSRDGHELFFVGPSGMMAAEVASSPTFHVTGVKTLFNGAFAVEDPTHTMYAVTRDGHFLMALRSTPNAPRTESSRLILIRHWFSEIRPLLEH